MNTTGYRSLKEGDMVEYDFIQGKKAPQADKVKLLEELAA